MSKLPLLGYLLSIQCIFTRHFDFDKGEEVYSDSSLSINEIETPFVLIQNIKDMLLENTIFRIIHTLREGNQSVGFMVNPNVSSNVDFLIHNSPPLKFSSIFTADTIDTLLFYSLFLLIFFFFVLVCKKNYFFMLLRDNCQHLLSFSNDNSLLLNYILLNSSHTCTRPLINATYMFCPIYYLS